jgi:glycosidase
MTICGFTKKVLVVGALAFATVLGATGCSGGIAMEERDPYAARPIMQVNSPEWVKTATIYQINTRQFTPEGTFVAAARQLPRLKDLGVTIVWLMPVHPIGVLNRKGSLGSPYSVRDYYDVNPEFGTKQDLKAFVDQAHALGLKVILDWVANHTAWDNNLAREHPDWYMRNWRGETKSTPWTDWADIIDLDYNQSGVRRYMTQAMAYWVREFGVDGFRCDVANFVPLNFWEQVRRELETIKPVFMLAEADSRDMHYKAFDATYAWGWNNALHDIGQGRADVGALSGFYYGHHGTFPPLAMRLMHVSNHDQNAWDATARERFGPATDAAIVLSVVSEGIPMMYNGQEAGDPKRLAFFERDPIPWRLDPMEGLYRNLFAFKKENPALWNGAWGAPMTPVANSAPKSVFSFVRQKGENRVFVAVNLSAREQTVTFSGGPFSGAYREHFTGVDVQLSEQTAVAIPAWGYRVYSTGVR